MVSIPPELETVYNDESWAQTSIFPVPEKLSGGTKNIGRYLGLIDRMSRTHPNLYYLRQELIRAYDTTDATRGRAVVLEFTEDRIIDRVFLDPQDLQKYFHEESPRPRGRLFVLEDVATDYVEAFGDSLSINPSFFARHLRTTSWENCLKASNSPPLPSISNGQVSFSICYPEVLKILNSEIRKERDLYCYCNVYRGIDMTRRNHFFDGIAVIRRLLSFWSQSYDDGSWDALMLVDPPVGRVVYSTNSKYKPIPVNCQPFQGGYSDFLTCTSTATIGENESSIQGPPRTSMFDDIIYYWTRRSERNISVDKPIEAAFYAKKIAAATWVNGLEYIRKAVSVLEWKLENGRQDKLEDSLYEEYEDLGWLEDILSVLYGWKWKCAHFSDLMDNNLIELDIPIKDMECLGEARLKDAQDWIYIRQKLAMWTSRTKDLIDSALGSIQLVESAKSIEEARNSRLLATLGTVFLPLSLVASVLSMGGDFLPGNGRFWVYFALSLPLLLVSLLVVFGSPMLYEPIRSWRTKRKAKAVPKRHHTIMEV